MTKEWSVTVEQNAETLLTISSQHVAGRELSDEQKAVVLTAARHLLAFIGKGAAFERDAHLDLW